MELLFLMAKKFQNLKKTFTKALHIITQSHKERKYNNKIKQARVASTDRLKDLEEQLTKETIDILLL